MTVYVDDMRMPAQVGHINGRWSLLMPQPRNAVQCLIYAKADDAGVRGARGGFRRDVEAIYLTGHWPAAVGGRTSLLRSRSWVAGPSSPASRHGHPHAKPLDLLEQLLMSAPHGVVADPFAGSGTTLVAARNLGRTAIGVEIDERYCEIAARRLDQMCLQFDPPSIDALPSVMPLSQDSTKGLGPHARRHADTPVVGMSRLQPSNPVDPLF